MPAPRGVPWLREGPLGVRTSRVLLGVLNKTSRDLPRVDISGMCAWDFVHQIHSWWNFWHRIYTGSCVSVQCGESSTEPSLCTTYEAASAGPSPTSVERPLHGVFQRWPDSVSGSSSGSKVLCFRILSTSLLWSSECFCQCIFHRGL